MLLRSHRENTSVTVSPSIAFNYVAFSPIKDSCFNDFGQTFAFEVTLQTLVILKKLGTLRSSIQLTAMPVWL